MGRTFDYDLDEIYANDGKTIRDALNKRDQDGWELVSVSVMPTGSALYAVFKQPYKPTASEPTVA